MTDAPGPWFERPLVRTAAVLAFLAYLPALTAAPGRMPSDSKLYLYLDPARFFGDAASTFDSRQFAGWVPHQHIAYLWPSTPWFWTFEAIGVPDWIAHRLWIGTIMLAAGLGVRWCGRLLGLGPMAAVVAAITYQLSLYVLPYVSRTSVMLLPWAGLGWVVAFTIRATRRRTWGDPAAIALIVLTVGAVNATALAMIVPAPVLWIVHVTWARMISWRDAAVVAMRTAVLSLGVSLWWIAMLVVQGRYGTDVLPYSESLRDVSLTATAPETWRSLGYWLFYVRDPYAAATTESLRYLSSTVSIAISYLVPIVALSALAWTRWIHRRFAAALIGVGLVLAVGVHPIDDRSPLMRLFAGGDDSGLALALRSSTRALPVTMLGMALASAVLVDAARGARLPRSGVPASWASAGVIALVAILNLPSLWTGAFVDPALERDQDPPAAWAAATDALDESGVDGRVLQLPGAEFGAYRWGYTVDQPLPGLTEKPLVTRDLLPLGSAGAMDLLFALDDRIQDGVLEPGSVAPVSQLLGVDTIWLTNDAAFERFRTARPEVVRDLVAGAPGIDAPVPYGEASVNEPSVSMTDERSLGDPRVGDSAAPVELAELERPGAIVRAVAHTIIVSGSGDGLVDAATAGLLDPRTTAVRYSADEVHRAGSTGTGSNRPVGLIVTDSNRDRARHWRSSQDTTGYTEPGGAEQDVLRPVSSDARLDVFDTTTSDTQTIAVQDGPVRATATSYGEPFAYLPEHRPMMAIDGDRSTAWLVGEHGDPVGETIRLELDEPVTTLTVHQPTGAGDRRITAVTLRATDGAATSDRVVRLTETSWNGTGQLIDVGGPSITIDMTIDEVAGGTPLTGSAVAAVGFTEIETGLMRTVEVVRAPTDAVADVDTETPVAYVLTRLRSDPMNRWRDDPEPVMVREIEVSGEREFDISITARVDARASDAELAGFLGWPVVASSRLTGSLRHAGIAAFDDDSDTAWITAFDDAVGATVATVATVPISAVAVSQPEAGYSRITTMVVRSAGQERTVVLDPDTTGTARGIVDPPLPSGPVEFVVAEIDPATTRDRRFGDVVTLPAAVSELRFDGRPVVEPPGTDNVAVPCTPVATIDGVVVSASIEIANWSDDAPIDAEPCEARVALGDGTHRIAADAGDLPVTIDLMVLDDGVRAAVEQVDEPPIADVVDRGRFDRTVRVDGCQDGCWLVVGEGFNDAWSATGPDGDLGAPTLVDGGFNGWWLPPTDEPRTVEVRWTAQPWLNWSIAASVLVAMLSITLLLVDRRRRISTRWSHDRPAVIGASGAGLSVRAIGVTTVTWVTVAVLLIGPGWGLGAILGGAVLLVLRHRRIVELTALASVLVMACMVVVRERRSAPAPNGGWPSTFESLHGVGMFAVVCVLVSAIVADDVSGIDQVDADATSAGRTDTAIDG